MCCVVPALVSLWFLLWCHCACSGGMLGFPRLHSLYRPYGKVSSMRIRVYRYLLQEFTGIYCKSLQVFTVRVPPLWCHPVPKTLRNAWKSSGVGTGAGRKDAQSCPTPNRSCATGKGLPSQRHQALLRTMTEDTELREFPGAELTLLPVSSDTFQPGNDSQDPSHAHPRTGRPPTDSVGSPNPVQHLHPKAIPALHLSHVSHLPSIHPTSSF